MLAGAGEHAVLDVADDDGPVVLGLDAADLGGELHAAAQELEQGAVDLGQGVAQRGQRIGRIHPRDSSG